MFRLRFKIERKSLAQEQNIAHTFSYWNHFLESVPYVKSCGEKVISKRKSAVIRIYKKKFTNIFRRK